MCFLSFISMTEAQGMARGEDNVESCMDESKLCTSFEDVPSCVDANRVITWLRPIGKAREDTHFGGNFIFPRMFRFLFPP